MEAEPYRSYFLQPLDAVHRQYEVLRTVFVEQMPMADVALRFGYRYDTVRDLVGRFRQKVDAGQPPPFSPPRRADVPAGMRHPAMAGPTFLPLPTPVLLA